jgi:LAO/AO transport system kinase
MISSDAIRQGNRLVISRFLSEVENSTPEGCALLNELFPLTGRAYLVGVTGAPGTGKSSLVNELVLHIRKTRQLKIAVVAVDPSSPFSGGALLGDRVRMRDLYGDEGIFIRSMASRGALGGLSLRTSAVVSALDAAGFELIFIETVGAGQTELDISCLAHTVLVVEAPGLGDDIQAIKAGILEIADILVVNKADLPGAEHTRRALESMLGLGSPQGSALDGHHHALTPDADEQLSLNEHWVDRPEMTSWNQPVKMTIALQREGISELVEAIFTHQQFVAENGIKQIKDKQRLDGELRAMITQALYEQWYASGGREALQEQLNEIYSRKLSPQTFIEKNIKIHPN